MKAVGLVILVATATTGVLGQEAPTFKAGVDLVALNVVVVNRQQQFVSGLTAGNFKVFEDGVQQDLSFFAAAELPLDLAIVLDTSASMAERMSTARQAAVNFVSALRPSDRLLAIDVKDTSRILAPLSDDIAAAKQAILKTTASGGTAIYNGMYLTLREMMRDRRGATDVRRQALVVLSDGDDTSSVVAFDDVMELAKQSGISIYTIVLSGGPANAYVDRRRHPGLSKSEFGMKSLAYETGGRSFAATDIGNLAGIYKIIGQELASQYALGYIPTNRRRDGGYRKVSVRLVDYADGQPRTRAGYLAPRS